MSKSICPICGKTLDDSDAEFLDNGSPAHPHCVAQERNLEEEKENQKNEKDN